MTRCNHVHVTDAEGQAAQRKDLSMSTGLLSAALVLDATGHPTHLLLAFPALGYKAACLWHFLSLPLLIFRTL